MEFRTAYRSELAGLVERLAEICGMAASAIGRATQALLQADLVLAEQVITDGEEIATLASYAEENAFAVLASQAPAAGDLRTVVSAIQMAADIGRMGGLALCVAKIVRRRHPEHALPEEVSGYFIEMGRIAVALSYGAGEVLLSRDPRKVAHIRQDDDAMNGLLRRLFAVLMDREWKHGVVATVDVTLLGRFYERFADRAVQVARGVIFQATGSFQTTGSALSSETWWPAVAAAGRDR